MTFRVSFVLSVPVRSFRSTVNVPFGTCVGLVVATANPEASNLTLKPETVKYSGNGPWLITVMFRLSDGFPFLALSTNTTHPFDQLVESTGLTIAFIPRFIASERAVFSDASRLFAVEDNSAFLIKLDILGAATIIAAAMIATVINSSMRVKPDIELR